MTQLSTNAKQNECCISYSAAAAAIIPDVYIFHVF